MVNSAWFSSTWKSDPWIQPCWLTLAPDLLFQAERRKEKKKSFWESPSLTFMGNLLAQLVLFPFKIKTHSPFPHFSIPAPPPHTSNFTWLFWEIPHNGQLVCTLPGKLHFFPFGSTSIAFFGNRGCIHVVWWCFLSAKLLCVSMLFLVFWTEQRGITAGTPQQWKECRYEKT